MMGGKAVNEAVPTNVPEDRSVGSKMINPYHTHDCKTRELCADHTATQRQHTAEKHTIPRARPFSQ